MKELDKDLHSREAELKNTYYSLAWKVRNLYWKVRTRLFPPGSLRERPFRFLKGLVLHSRNTIILAITMIEQAIFFPKKKVIKAQNVNIEKNFSKDTPRLIVFLVPGVNVVAGGLMSICSLAKVSQSAKPIHNGDVLLVTLPGSSLLTKFTLFENPFDIYRFEQLYSYFTNIEELTIHLPENFVIRFLACLTEAEKEFLLKIPTLHINIMNQNIWLMPSRETVSQVKQLTEFVTCTTAHSKYCTQELREYYGIPFHNFSASNLTEYHYSSYRDKKNLMVISNDSHKYKNRILAKIRSEHPEMTIKIIEKVPYEEYKRLLSRAKWVITFGEGLDGYFVESIRSGAIPFAVYNTDFFTDRFKNLPNVYRSYEEMNINISNDMDKLSEPSAFENLSKKLIELDKQEYDDEKYKDNVRRFYTGEYDFP
jgi:hypothetical protein